MGKFLLFFMVGQLLKARTSRVGIETLKNLEDFSPVPYKDQAGNWTIGYGHKILPGEQFTEITKDQALRILQSDLSIAQNAVRSLVTVPLSPHQFDALVLFVFNVGVSAFETSTLLRLLNSGDYIGAANELHEWKYVTIDGQKIESIGLVKRRKDEYNLFLS